MVYKFDFFASVRSGAVHLVIVWQSNCLICLPDKSGNFLAFRAEIAQNTVKPAKTGFGMVNETAPGPVFAFSGQKFRAPFGANALSKVVGKS